MSIVSYTFVLLLSVLLDAHYLLFLFNNHDWISKTFTLYEMISFAINRHLLESTIIKLLARRQLVSLSSLLAAKQGPGAELLLKPWIEWYLEASTRLWMFPSLSLSFSRFRTFLLPNLGMLNQSDFAPVYLWREPKTQTADGKERGRLVRLVTKRWSRIHHCGQSKTSLLNTQLQ